MMDAEIYIEMVPLGLNVLALPGWDGCSAVVPMYKQVFELFSTPVMNVDIELPKVEFPKMEFPKVEDFLPKINIDEIKERLPQLPMLKNVRRGAKKK